MENGSVENKLNNSNMLINDFDYSYIFLRDNKYESASYTNDGYDSVTLNAGTLMGREGATLEVVPLASGASDGSENPYGILTRNTTVGAGETVTVRVCVAGEVAEGKIVLDGSDTLDTLINNRPIRDLIGSSTVGIKLVGGTELTAVDNS